MLMGSTVVAVPIVTSLDNNHNVVRSTSIQLLTFHGNEIINQLHFCSSTYISNEEETQINITIDDVARQVTKMV
jgi:hypothetical protein